MKLEEIKLGRTVVYTPFEGCEDKDKEIGVVKTKTDKYAFVQYGDDQIAKATNAADLEYIEPAIRMDKEGIKYLNPDGTVKGHFTWETI